MRAPRLYSYFGSKHDIYDAMFASGQEQMRLHLSFLPDDVATRHEFRQGAQAFFRFCTEDPVRYQLMFQRTIPGFEPSAESYAMAQAHIDRFASQLAGAGVTDARFVDLWTAMMSGLTSQQIANDPGGDRWAGLLDEAVDLFCDHAGIAPQPATKSDR
jgi:AcrR family transcriptional regulator